MPAPGSLQVLAGPLEVKFKAGAFSTWSDSFVRLEGRWICVYKRERDSTRQGAIELGLGVSVTDISNPEASTKFPRRFDLNCNGGLLPKTEVNFRTKSRKDRDLWVQAIAGNLQCLASPRGQDPRFGVREMAPVASKMRHGLVLHPIRIRSDLTVRCATGETIVAFLVEQGLVPDRVTAAAFCRQLVAMNLLHHVMWDRDFTDSPEPFVIVAVDTDNLVDAEDDYHVAHFLKYMDSRKFWKYLASPDAVDASSLTAASNVSSGSRRAASSSTFLDQSTSSSDSGRGIGLIPGSDDEAARFSTLSVSNSIPTATSKNAAEKKARKCAVCTKSFNPLRRRHHCRQCRAVICSNCSVVRRAMSTAGEPTESAASPSRICISCKLSSNESFMSEVDDVAECTPQLQASQSASDVLTSTSSTSDGMGNSVRHLAASTQDFSEAFCHHCQNENCAPVTEFLQISYPVDPPTDVGFVTAKRLDNDTERLQSVNGLLVTMAATPSATRVLRQFCNMAAIASQCPIAAVGLLDRDNYVLGAQYGVSLGAAVPRKQSLAAHTCRSGTSLVCADLNRDVRFKGNSWRVEGLNNAAFYAGIPLVLSNGHTVGALEVFDAQPRFECGEVLGQLQTVVRGLLNLFEEIVTAAAEAQQEELAAAEKQAQKEAAVIIQEKVEAPAVNPMEAQLLQLLSQTTTTQEQLRTQQGQMVSAISSHSKQIDNLAKQLERIEATLAAKLDSETRVE